MPDFTDVLSLLGSSVSPAAGIAGVAGGLISGISGLFQKRKAKKMLAGLQRPQYNIPNEVLQNQKMAQLRAQQGLPSQQYAKAQQDIQRQQNRGLTAATDRKTALMALPTLQQQSNDSLLNLNIANAQAQQANERQLYGINSQVAQYRDKAFDINQMQPYQQNYNYAMGLLGAGNQNINTGLDKLVAGGGQLLSGTRFGTRRRSQQNTAIPDGGGDGYNQNGPIYIS